MSDTIMDERLYPALREGGAEEAVRLIEYFKTEFSKAIENTIFSFYADVLPYIETDAWTNFTNSIIDAVADYGSFRKTPFKSEAKRVRQAILAEFRSELIEDLNQDNLNEIERLKEQIEYMRRTR